MSDLTPPEGGNISDESTMSTAASSTATLKMVMGSFYIPKDNRSKPFGEDAHFIAADKQTAGVADGVGGWSKQGIDAGRYARALIASCVDAVADANADAIILPTVLATAFDRTTFKQGSSTVCLVHLDGNVLRSMYVGDSGFMVFRNDTCIYKSPVQQHKFNQPYQLGAGPGCDRPEQGIMPEVEVMAGDIVVVGTDGLMDNVYEEEIEKVLEMTAADMAAPEDLARHLAALAMFNSYDRNFVSPFAVASLAAGPMRIGGKIDDITVIVGRIMAVDFTS